MNVGTKSVLYGAHAFWLHPWFVAAAWTKLFGFPWDPRLWVAFVVHDLGYLGSPNMDGEEGEAHPWWAARVMATLFDRRDRRVFHRPYSGEAVLLGRWGLFVLLHSRFVAKRLGNRPSRLCVADKLAIVLTPGWLYLPMARATGEIDEYRKLAKDEGAARKYVSMSTWAEDEAEWYRNVQEYLRRWVEEHRDGRADTWTPDLRVARDDSGVWE